MPRPATPEQRALSIRWLSFCWPACLVSGPIFVAWKLVEPRLGWETLLAGVMLTFLGFQLRDATRKLAARQADTPPH